MYTDVIIIGAGIVGCSLARELSRYNISIKVLETKHDVSEGASKANSGIVHAGHDAEPGSLKAKLNIQGAAMFESICEELGTPYRRNGALVIGFDDYDLELITKLYEKGLKNGVQGLELLNGEQTLNLEPNVSKEVRHALNVPTSAIVSPYELTYDMADHAKINGVDFRLNTEVTGLAYQDDNLWHIQTNNGEYIARTIVNCAGVFSAKLHCMISPKPMEIIPRKGEYFVLDRKTPLLFNKTIFQTPSKMGKGVLVTPTTHGNILLGPSSTDVDDPLDVTTTSDMLSYVFERSKLTWSEANRKNLITTFAGIRAHEVNGDFIIGKVEGAKDAYETVGIESPGLTASPAIAKMLCEQIVDDYGYERKCEWLPAPKKQKSFHNMTTEERVEAINLNHEYGKVVCRCEKVTEAEIKEAIHRPVGATTVDGIKRRTRAGMGRCQGGFCSPQVIDIIARELNINIQDVKKSDLRSKIFFGNIDSQG